MVMNQTEPSLHEDGKTNLLSSLLKNFWALLLLVVVTATCIIIVQTLKKPGQMSVLESQSMDMTSMAPPKGAVPVAIAQVTKEAVSGAVTYTGSVQAYNDDDIYPRVTGRVTKMPVYPGDIVRAGQLLVQLDPTDNSEYSAKRQEAQDAESAAMHNAGIAKSEYSQKKFELEAAKEAESAARQSVLEATANLAYWKPELERQSALLKSQVVSLDEYQKELAQLNTAQAQVEQAQAKLREAKNTRMAAQAALDTMTHHVSHQDAEAKQAEAALKNSVIYERYTRIVAQEDGVVTKRLISPGVVVNPGMMLLKVAYIKRVRVQAEVASDDANQIKIGTKVYIKGAQDSQNEVVATITSIFPAADPVSRTVTVEAVIDNVSAKAFRKTTQVGSVKEFKFLPGQYVVMRIATSQQEGLAIPTSAIVWREGKPQVWKANPSSSSQATLVDIKVGSSNADKTEVIEGLKKGDGVIYAGQSNLQPGMTVIATEWGKTGPVKLPTAADVQGNRLSEGNKFTHEEMSGTLMVKVSMQPAKGDSNSIVVKVDKHGGGAVAGAQVAVKTSMPGMGDMAGPSLSANTDTSGEARMKSDLSSGLWRLKITVNQAATAPVQMTLDAEVP